MRNADQKTIEGVKKWYTDVMEELSAKYNDKWEKADGNADAIKAANVWYEEREHQIIVEYWERVTAAMNTIKHMAQ